KLGDYSFVSSELENLRKRERELLMTYKPAYPLVQTVHNQITRLAEQKSELERLYPLLTQVALGGSRSSTNVAGTDMAGELMELKRLEARAKELGSSLSNLQAEAILVLDMEPRIRQLERQRDEEERNYRFILSSLEQRKMGEAFASGKITSVSVVQSPTPPGVDLKKMLKLVGCALAGCIGLGLGLAFAIDLFLDRSLKRTVDVERHLRLPVFLTIPDTSWTKRCSWPWLARRRNGYAGKSAQVPAGELGPGDSALAPWSPGHELQTYAEGLRERVLTYFEARNLNLKKPKLVAVTGCGKGAGATTLAGGLAAALSKTGDGNVLLVDMNVDQGTAQSFYKGNPSCALSDVLEPEQRADAQVQENLYLATINNSQTEPLAKVLPARFTHLMPKLKASDYDYIIFDMPPVSQTSATPRLAGYMDLVLLVLESGKTGQQVASRATSLMRESRANVATVLNKYRPHVPASLSQEL
ncbi:MAG TPA: cellulose synthase operon protein YhjQ/BcsQ, partial [Candidatus Sulfotelmatobacter sp.]|nr:cellulose synthase operon protein YhjQ/BcsQ [Candidatus Sulfotelmatobacter sp.]